MNKLKISKRFFQEHPKIIINILSFLVVLIAILIFFSYYLDKYTKIIDILIILLTLILSIDSFIHLKHIRNYKSEYRLLAMFFMIIFVVHTLRFLFGPLHCSMYFKFFSIYLYDGIAFVIGILLIYLSVSLIKNKSGLKYHHTAGIVIGMIMIITHSIKIFIGKCV